MFISTREMLGQVTTSRALAESVIENCYGPNCDWSKILGDEAISSTLHKLGLSAFSDGALQHIASALSNQQRSRTEPLNDLVHNGL
jgi:hypothetical protein